MKPHDVVDFQLLPFSFFNLFFKKYTQFLVYFIFIWCLCRAGCIEGRIIKELKFGCVHYKDIITIDLLGSCYYPIIFFPPTAIVVYQICTNWSNMAHQSCVEICQLTFSFVAQLILPKRSIVRLHLTLGARLGTPLHPLHQAEKNVSMPGLLIHPVHCPTFYLFPLVNVGNHN